MLEFIGRTRLISLQHLVPEDSARILVKLEYENPTGSMKDRMALAMVEAAEEIWEQTEGQVSAFVQSVGTAGSLRGVSASLRAHNEAVHIVAVEPEESAVLSGRPSGSHKIEGTGAGFVVPLWNETLADEIQTVSTQQAMATARQLALHEGIFAGTSTGGNVAVALRIADRLGPDQTVVTVAVDSGMKYLSTELYSGT